MWFASVDGTRLHWDGTRLVALSKQDGLNMFGVFSFGRQRVMFAGYDGNSNRTTLDYRR